MEGYDEYIVLHDDSDDAGWSRVTVTMDAAACTGIIEENTTAVFETITGIV